ncbi:MAG: hypothetical protein NC120_06925 [Ruminococcus sp.]|nr:hypothetical protein [Ruminococcus sp.]
MAFFDWNHDGKKDFADDFIEYQIYQDVMNDNDEDEIQSDYIPPSKTYRSSPPPTADELKGLLKANAIIWSIVLILYLLGN